MTRITYTKIERIKMRGYCTGPETHVPAIGSVDIEHNANCGECGRTVKVTVRGRFAHHKPQAPFRRRFG